MRHVDIRPELSDAAGHQVRVAVQILARLERRQLAFVLSRKQAEVVDHALDDGLDDLLDTDPVIRGQGAKRREAVGQPFEQIAFGRQRLRADGVADGGEPARLGSASSRPECFEMGDAGATFDQARVGDRIGCAREEIGEADRGPDRGRENGEREVERAADAFQQRGGEIASGHEASA